MIERNTRKTRLVIAKSRSVYSLNEIIEENVSKNAIIYTDQWPGYSRLT